MVFKIFYRQKVAPIVDPKRVSHIIIFVTTGPLRTSLTPEKEQQSQALPIDEEPCTSADLSSLSSEKKR